MPPKGWIRHEDASDVMHDLEAFEAKLAADPAAKYEHLKAKGTIRRARERGWSDERIERAYEITIPPEDRRN